MKPDPTCILVDDDDPIILKMTARLLEEAGHQGLPAASGEEGLQLAQEGEPDLILLDVVLRYRRKRWLRTVRFGQMRRQQAGKTKDFDSS